MHALTYHGLRKKIEKIIHDELAVNEGKLSLQDVSNDA